MGSVADHLVFFFPKVKLAGVVRMPHVTIIGVSYLKNLTSVDIALYNKGLSLDYISAQLTSLLPAV